LLCEDNGEEDWINYKCKSGQTIFLYNKITGEHKWPPGNNNVSDLAKVENSWVVDISRTYLH